MVLTGLGNIEGTRQFLVSFVNGLLTVLGRQLLWGQKASQRVTNACKGKRELDCKDPTIELGKKSALVI